MNEPECAIALKNARLLVSGSAPLPVPVFDRLHELTGHRPVERYGMTETLITLSARADGDRRPGYVGFPVRGVTTRLVADDGSLVDHDGDSIGELQVRGPMLGSKYLSQPEATAASWIADGWFRTGDIASIDPAGWHRIVGRASIDLIKTGGYRIGAGEVEDALLAHPAVREAAVIGVPDDDLGQLIRAFVVADESPKRISSPTSPRCSPRTSGRERSDSSTNFRATPWVRSRSGVSADQHDLADLPDVTDPDHRPHLVFMIGGPEPSRPVTPRHRAAMRQLESTRTPAAPLGAWPTHTR